MTLNDPAIPDIAEADDSNGELHVYWAAEIPYLPELTPYLDQTRVPDNLASYLAWLCFVAALSQLPIDRRICFDLRYRFSRGEDGLARIQIVLIGSATGLPKNREAVIENARFAWRALNGLFPPDYPLQLITKDQIIAWLNPYGNKISAIEIRKRVSSLGEHPLKQIPYRFHPKPIGLLQTCRAMVERGQDCLVSIAIIPTSLNKNEREVLNQGLFAARLELPSIDQAKPWAKIELLQREYRELIADIVDVNDIARNNPYSNEADAWQRSSNVHIDPQIAAAIEIYSQLLFAPALLAMRITVVAPIGQPVQDLAHTLGADLAGMIENPNKLLMTGYEIVDPDNQNEIEREKTLNRILYAESISENEPYRIAVLCTPYEAASAFCLPLIVGRWAGIPTRLLNPFRPTMALSDQRTLGIGKKGENIPLGKIIDDTLRQGNLPDYLIELDDLTQHALIVGGTGSGKTTTGLHIIQKVRETRQKGRNIHVLMIDPVKTELRPFIRYPIAGEDFLIYSVGSTFSPLRLDVFRVPDGVSPEQHLQMLVACFSAAFPMGGVLEMLLTRSMRDVYRELFSLERLTIPLEPEEIRPITPDNILQFLAYNASKRIESYVGDIKGNLTAAVQHRLEWLAEGVIGHAIVPKPGDTVLDVDTLIKNDVLIELRLLPGNEEKALIMALLLVLLGEHYSYSLAARGEISETGGELRHLTWVDEAQRLFSGMPAFSQDINAANARGKVIELFVELLSEMRSRGEGLIISTQLPSLLDARVRKHPGMKIMHRLTPEDDRAVLGATMDLDQDQQRFVTRLGAGEAAVFRGQLPAAVLVKVPDIRREWAKIEANSEETSHEDWLSATVVSDPEVESCMQNLVYGQVYPISEFKTKFERQMAPPKCRFCKSVDIKQGCLFSIEEIYYLINNRNKEVDIQQVWNALSNKDWNTLLTIVSQMVYKEENPALVYCIVAHMILSFSNNSPKKAEVLGDSLVEFALIHGITWATRPVFVKDQIR